jgi:hypothetical protein
MVAEKLHDEPPKNSEVILPHVPFVVRQLTWLELKDRGFSVVTGDLNPPTYSDSLEPVTLTEHESYSPNFILSSYKRAAEEVE